MSRLDHVSVPASDYDVSLAFYEAALKPLGITTQARFEDADRKVAGLGSDHPFLWVADGAALQGGHVHIAIAVDTRAEVDAFHAAALAAGATDNGAPGLRPHYHPNYYAAFVLDPDGHNLEAVCHAPR
jgi:catechol 2,3-dioxygenase-like lactoylglutathione lyase family enzyme